MRSLYLPVALLLAFLLLAGIALPVFRAGQLTPISCGRVQKRALTVIFTITLLVSIICPPAALLSSLGAFAHNQWTGRLSRATQLTPPNKRPADMMQGHSAGNSSWGGLWKDQLEALDPEFRQIYWDAVSDGSRLGEAYSELLFSVLGADFLLFLTSIFALGACCGPRLGREPPEYADAGRAHGRTLPALAESPHCGL